MIESVLITGSSRRLGSLIARDLASSGAFVWIHYRSGKVQAETLKQAIRNNGGEAECVAADLTDTDQIDAMLEKVGSTESGALTTLINNASLFLNGRLEDTDVSDWDRVLNTNLKAVWYLSSRFVSLFPSAGRIITIGDASASGVYTEHAVYGLSKYALKYLTEQMAASFYPRLSVNLLSPGFVLKGKNEPDRKWNERLEQTLLDNGKITEQILKSIRYLMSDPGMTGSELLIDNGLHLRSKMKL